MNQELIRLREASQRMSEQIQALEDQKRANDGRIAELERQCSHDWEEKYTPVHHPGHHSPGDPPGTMGVDWRPPMDFPPSTEPKWTRTCKRCGRVETTTRTRQEPVTKPSW